MDSGPYEIIYDLGNGAQYAKDEYYNRTTYVQNGWAYHNTTT